MHVVFFSLQVAPKVKAMMMEKGTTMVGYQPLGNIPNFFRMVISNPAVEAGDVDFLLDEIERLGEEIEPGEIQSPHK
jgi:glutamate decarboxylase